MQYANIDVSSIAPTHLASAKHAQQEGKFNEMKHYCAICKTEVCLNNAKTQPNSMHDMVSLPCKHIYHYVCLRNTSVYKNAGSSCKECPVCRQKYSPFDVPDDDIYVPGFHKKKQVAGNEASSSYSEVNWNSIAAGMQLVVGPNASKYKNQAVIFLKQTKCQATVELPNGLMARFSKKNLTAPSS